MNKMQMIYVGIGLVIFLAGYFMGRSSGFTKAYNYYRREAENQRSQQMWSNYFNQFGG
ncbi:hypothetical protein [Syntrophus aciditrophicus]|nr:hypothetical protein [Syntrophus aciditrophicus]